MLYDSLYLLVCESLFLRRGEVFIMSRDYWDILQVENTYVCSECNSKKVVWLEHVYRCKKCGFEIFVPRPY